MRERLRRTQTLDVGISVVPAEEIVGQSSGDAYAEAERWLTEQRRAEGLPVADDGPRDEGAE